MTLGRGRVLISTHDLPKAGALRDGFEGAGYETELVTPGEHLSADGPAALLVLTGLDKKGGSDLARQARERLHVPVFAIGAGEVLPPALRPGFDEVFSRSASAADIVLLGTRIIERRRLRALTGIVGETDAIHQVLERVVQIAPVHSTVLVTGESGTGKELVARGIHALSPRRHEPFIAVNVAALSETLLESELFGHEKGAFTGAERRRQGRFERADGGTLFLDEITEMGAHVQAKLLRVLQGDSFERVGGEEPVDVDVRLLAATNRDPEEAVEEGRLRKDLFYRLNIVRIDVPPLRERALDVPILAESFFARFSAKYGKDMKGISEE
ncbi:MAG TPA: sigma 54-interacting transcriptional regulator, partial [Longimicrobiales bacterium]|nr:sigma 54-interacting transcriptional regulator [Longimicrobiales bacterium]